VCHNDEAVEPNEKEVNNYAYHSMDAIEVMLQTQPDQFTAWFHIAFPKVMEWWKQNP
jgi:isopentenyl-diphosphate delta-isomerase